MSKQLITLTVNGEPRELAVEPHWTLAEVLREQLGLTGVKIGCDVGDCGACTVLLDGKPILSCLTLAVTVEGRSIETIEALARNGVLHPLQKSFLHHGATQCGFCTPGMILTSKAILGLNDTLSEDVVREQLSGNMCRCTGYTKIVEAVQNAHLALDVAPFSPVKVDAVGQVTGGAKYADDLTLPRMLYGKILRSPHAHAKIVSIDTSKAEAHPGVVAVMIGSELLTKYGILPASQDETALCIDKVRFVGDGVAAVAAVDERTAQEALKLIIVQYELLAPVLSMEDALRTDLPKIHSETKYEDNVAKHVTLEFGNVEEGFTEADLVREDEFYYGASTHAMLEPHSALASFEPPSQSESYKDGHLTVWSATQTPHYVHRTLAKVLEMPASHIRVIKPYLGGGFGGKSEPFALEFCAAWLSIKSGRPVKITYTREEVFYSHRGRHATKMHLKTGVKKDGSITAVQYKSILDGGAYGSYGVVTAYYSGQFLTMPYKVPRYKFESTRFYTNKPPAGPKRGHGAVQPRFAFEVHLDRIANDLRIDPAELRLRNLVEPNSMTVNSLRITSCGVRECIEAVMKASGWQEKHVKLPRGRGLGMAASAYISGAGKEINWLGLPHSGAVVKVDRGGGVTVFCGSSDIGQGSNTVLAHLTAQTLGIDIGHVRVYEADTDLTPVDLGSYSSRVTFMAGNAVLRAAEDLKSKIFDAVAEKFQTAKEDLIARSNEILVHDDSTKRLSFVEAARLAEAKFGTLSAVGWYTPPQLGGTYKGAGAGPSPSYSFTAHVAEVEVDEETGHVKVCKVWSAHDCGKALNKTLVEGQIEGSVHMGIGEALTEEMTYTRTTKETPGGLLKATSLLDYKIPTSLDTPSIDVTIVETIDPEGPMGAKEAGEGPLLAVPPAIANAIYDAVGIRLLSVPFTPEKVLAALRGQTRAEKVISEPAEAPTK
ncbi:MAG: molybdopterin-dependent oxidoreductase [Ignavibacteria bacterium]|nr:molybdopterin-dependent oxidoreductase [Ignavibacteria bacterium]